MQQNNRALEILQEMSGYKYASSSKENHDKKKD